MNLKIFRNTVHCDAGEAREDSFLYHPPQSRTQPSSAVNTQTIVRSVVEFNCLQNTLFGIVFRPFLNRSFTISTRKTPASSVATLMARKYSIGNLIPFQNGDFENRMAKDRTANYMKLSIHLSRGL